MSIFKQSFPKWVRDQLSTRQILQNGPKTNNALIWNQSKQCIIRATSLVDYVGDVGISLGGSDFPSLKGSKLAQQFILQGGILQNGQTRSATFGQPGSAYGDPLLGSNGDNIDGFGHVPMPGITSLDVTTKSAYGSLRQAKLNFTVHNLRQLEIMEMLYMRPGYPVLVEWGWAPFVRSDGSLDYQSYKIPQDIIFAEYVDQEKVYHAINRLKKDAEGNYDGFLGFVNNFGYQVRKDGGFDCFAELVSMGEALDSLKVGTFKSAISKKYPNLDVAFKLDDTDEEIKNPDVLRAILLGMARLTGTVNTGGAEMGGWTLQWTEDRLNNGVYNLINVLLENIFEGFEPIKDLASNEEKEEALKAYILRKNQVTEAGKFSAPLNTGYIRWDLLSYLINALVIPNDNLDKPTVQIVLDKKINDPKNNDRKTFQPLEYAHFKSGNDPDIIDLSCDPRVCMLPHSWFDERLQDTVDTSQGWLGQAVEGLGDFFERKTKKTWNSIEAFFDDDVEDIDDLGNNNIQQDQIYKKKGDQTFKRYIGAIYLNTEMLLKAYDSTIKGNKNADLGSFLKRVWEDVNEACPLHNFIFRIDDEYPNQAYAIDLPVDNEGMAEIKDEIFVVEVQSNKSVVREYNLEASIPDALKSTVAIHAQNPDSTEDLDDVTFNAFNKAIKNRLFTKPTPSTTDETTDEGTTEEDEDRRTPLEKLIDERNETAKEFGRLRSLYFEIISYDENLSVNDSDSAISDLKSTLKKLQTLTLQIESQQYKTINTSAVIPLEFNLTFDGISSIVMGSVFKIKEDRLPKAYRNDTPYGANVGFIVFKEEQSITAGQDWTTKIGGKMIMLPNENHGKGLGKNQGGLPGIDSLGKYLDKLPINNQTKPLNMEEMATLPLKPTELVNNQPEPELVGEIQDIPPTPTSSLEDSSVETTPPPATEEQLLQEFINLDRRYLEKKYTHDILIEATWMSGTNVYTNQITDLKFELGDLVDRWENFKPQIEGMFGPDWGNYNSGFQDKWRNNESNQVLNVDINGQNYKVFIDGGGVSNLRPDTAETYLNSVFTLDSAETI